MAQDELRALRIFFSGSVQGVGFRYATQRAAGAYAVTGWVRNRSDGRVEALIEGREPEIEEMLRDLESEMGAYISRRERTWEPYKGERQTFSIDQTF